jgi:hypothetical protein
MRRKKLASYLLLVLITSLSLAQSEVRDVQSDTWVATDALGRELPGYEECGPLKENRYVGMFYFITNWLGPDSDGPYNVGEILAENPDDPQWGPKAHYWGEPEIGYYQNEELWAIRRHAYQLSDAGVDVVIFDVTNDATFPEVYIPICEEWTRMRAEGNHTPDIAFLASEIATNTLWEHFYKPGKFQDLWFYWKGKPLLLVGQHEIPRRKLNNDIVFRDEIYDFFSMKQSWAWTSLPWYDDGKDEWPWVDHFPQTIGWHEDPSIPEQVPVAVAQHPFSNIGRSFHHFHQPQVDQYDLTPYTDEGLHFQEQWNRALEVDPEFVFVTGWNEWTATSGITKEDVIETAIHYDFYPGAHLGMAGEPLRPGMRLFIDQYNQEYSRDIEPMKGGHTDNYYYQLISNVRKYKGVPEPVQAGDPLSINISGSFKQWEQVHATYYDHLGDTGHRNHMGDCHTGPYVNASGRNDILESKVARDQENFFVYVKTREKLTSYKDADWMLLYIDADQDKTTGWEGYDLLINSEVNSNKTILKRYVDGAWIQKAELDYSVKGNELMVAIPREEIGGKGFDFHWCDNVPVSGDISDFFTLGDNAPERRSNYRFKE